VLLYTPPGPAGSNPPTGLDSFVYTLSDGRNGFSDATVTVNVINFVPKTVSGTVYVDNDGSGTPNAGDILLSSVRVDLTGADFQGAVVALSTTTDGSGNYSFANLRPGTYVVHEFQPQFMFDGPEQESSTLATLPAIDDDTIHLSWQPQDQNDITGLNFTEGGGGNGLFAFGTGPGQINMSGLPNEFDSSTFPRDGFFIATDLNGSTIWSWTLNGWQNAGRLSVDLSPDTATATLRLLDKTNVAPITIYQWPGDPNYSSSFSNNARFRILGYGFGGTTCILRIDGTLADFGLVAAAPAAGGEGEGSSDPNFARSADAVFANEAWA
jgi:hypothetical protein